MAMSCASRRVGRKGERRAEDVGGRIVSLVVLVENCVLSLPLASGLRRVAIFVWVVGKVLGWSNLYVVGAEMIVGGQGVCLEAIANSPDVNEISNPSTRD